MPGPGTHLVLQLGQVFGREVNLLLLKRKFIGVHHLLLLLLLLC